MQLWTEIDTEGLDEKFAAWIDMVATMHDGANNRVNETTAFVPWQGDLAEAKVALVSTAGVHLQSQEPFDTSTTKGDSTYRLIPDDANLGDLRFSHTHYDTSSAEIDPNVVFPLERLHEFVANGRLGSTNSFHVGLMGFNPDPTTVADDTAPKVAELLSEADVDAVLLVPG